MSGSSADDDHTVTPIARPRDPELDELLGAYVTGSVDDAEARRIEAYLDRTPAARAEVVHLTFALDEIVELLTVNLAAPRTVWENIVATIEDDRADHPSGTTTGSVIDLRDHRGATAGPVIDPNDGARRTRHPFTMVAGAAAAVLLVLVGVLLGTRLSSGSSNDLASSLATRTAQLTAAPGTREADLTGPPALGRIHVIVGADGTAVVVPHDVPAPAAGHQYQLWTIDRGTPVSLAVMDAEPAEMQLPPTVQVTQLAVSVEPLGGSPAPTSTPVLLGSLA